MGQRVKSTGRLHVWETLGPRSQSGPEGPDDARLAPDMLYIGHIQIFLRGKIDLRLLFCICLLQHPAGLQEIRGFQRGVPLRSAMLFTKKSRKTDTRLLFRSSSGYTKYMSMAGFFTSGSTGTSPVLSCTR